ncbi:MAG: hypothetical protein IAF02_12295 [Anaerolineae bacterium]|nr:hypothetical protein [Anaerolineae bacterium]
MSNLRLFETSTESFIVKIWTTEEDDNTAWHGQITHVLSGEKQIFNSLAEIEQFMLPYLQNIGMDLDSTVFN